MLTYSNLEKPTYKLQEGENKRAHFYFNRKVDEGLSQRQMEAQLKLEYDMIMSESWSTHGQLRQELKPYFHKYDINKAIKNYDFEKQKIIDGNVIPITKSVINNWSIADCWEARERDRINDDEEDLRRIKLAKKRKTELHVFDNKLSIQERLSNRLLNELSENSLSQINQGIQGFVSIDDNITDEIAEDTPNELIVNAGVNAKIETKKDNYLFVDDLEEFNLDEAFDEVTENVDE